MAIESFNNLDDIKATFIIKDNDGVVIPYLEFDWELQLFTIDTHILSVTCTNGVLSSNAKLNGTILTVCTDAFNWGCNGTVNAKFLASFPDTDFTDGKQDCSSVPTLMDYKIVNV